MKTFKILVKVFCWREKHLYTSFCNIITFYQTDMSELGTASGNLNQSLVDYLLVHGDELQVRTFLCYCYYTLIGNVIAGIDNVIQVIHAIAILETWHIYENNSSHLENLEMCSEGLDCYWQEQTNTYQFPHVTKLSQIIPQSSSYWAYSTGLSFPFL